MVTGAEPAFFYDWDGEHVAVPSAGLLERSRRLLRKTTVATRCPTTVLRRLAPPPGYDGQFDEPNGGLLGRSVRFTARDIFLEEGWSAPPRGWRSGPNRSRASRRDRPVEGKACGGLQEFCPRRGGTWSSAFGTASARLKRLEVVKQHNAARGGGLRERRGGGRTRHGADALFVFLAPLALGGCRHGRLRVQLRRSPCQSTRRE